MADSRIKVEVHLIQNFAPSNLNRDDTGQPKDATFGGFRRARISSQCLKRSMRQWWKENNTMPIGERTKRLQALLFEQLQKNPPPYQEGQDEAFLKEGIRVFTDTYYAEADIKDPEKTNVLTFISRKEVEECAQIIRELWLDKPEAADKKKTGQNKGEGIASVVARRRMSDLKKASKKKSEGPESTEAENETDEDHERSDKKSGKKLKLEKNEDISRKIKSVQLAADIALFGRMLAEQPGRNTDGACQVAHAISTHKVDMEMDFFTAVDDLNPAEETGAGMMGVVGFNSACFYRYALVDRDTLARNLAGKTERSEHRQWTQELEPKDYEEADKVIRAFLEAMVYAIPTGKQHSFAAQNPPSFGLFTVRRGGVPVSLANAFAKPVRPTVDDEDLVGLSVARLVEHWNSLKKVYGDQGLKTSTVFHVGQDGRLGALAEGAVDSVAEAIEKCVKGLGEV